MYELIILSLLMRFQLHGYLMMKITNDQIGPWARISSGTLSTILAKMEQMGLIAVLPEGRNDTRVDRRARVYTITDEGRKRFRQLMMDTSSNLGEYQKFFHHKLVYIDLLRPDERLLLLNHYINYCQTTILHTQSEMEGIVYELADHPDPVFLENVLRNMKHTEQLWLAEFDWAKSVREQELSKMATPPEDSV